MRSPWLAMFMMMLVVVVVVIGICAVAGPGDCQSWGGPVTGPAIVDNHHVQCFHGHLVRVGARVQP